MPTAEAKVTLPGRTKRRATPTDPVRPKMIAPASRTDLPRVRRRDSEKVNRLG